MQRINPDDESDFTPPAAGPRLYQVEALDEPPLARHPWLRVLIAVLVLLTIGLACAMAKLSYDVRQLDQKVDQLRPSLLPPWRMP